MAQSLEKVIYDHVVFNGTAYEIGKAEGEYLKKYHPEQVKMFTEGSDWVKPTSESEVKKAMEVFQNYCPNINEEIDGLAESLEVSRKSIIHYAFSYVSRGNCGHFAVLPKKTMDNHLYVGRSYEWSMDDDLRLVTVKAEGLNAHIGFSILLLGRFDGMNEHGLCVTMSNAVPCEQPKEEGLRFWMVIRILLDKCKTTEEAVQVIKELPISSYCNLIIADKHNNVVLAEIYSDIRCFKKINEETEETYLCSTNHYTLPSMERFIRNKMRQSVMRYNSITGKMDNENKVNKDDLKQLLSKHMPEGLACHYYSDYLGTLWSMLFDVTKGKLEVCFGSPVVNKWHGFDLNSETGVTKYSAVLPKEEADISMWDRMK